MSVTSPDGQTLSVRFVLETEQLLERVTTPIHDNEPLFFLYQDATAVGVSAPAVWSGRDDFPRDIGHINPTPPDVPASLCLSRVGLQPIYDRYGIDGVMQRLVSWFHDAKTGQLMADGWEPVPFGENQLLTGGILDIAHFQNLAASQPPGPGSAYGLARKLGKNLGEMVLFLALDNEPNPPPAALKGAKHQLDKELTGDAVHIPWVFLWTDREAPIDRQFFGVWNTYEDIENGLSGTGLEEQFSVAVMNAVMTLGKPVALLLGVWRPQPISSTVFGLSEDETARRLELRAYVLECADGNNPIAPGGKVKQVLSSQLPSRRMLEFTSGNRAPSSAALLGYGALGSCLADYLLRGGIHHVSAMDKDIIAAHNIARHACTVADIGADKLTHLQRLATQLSLFPDEIHTHLHKQDICTLSEEAFGRFAKGHNVLIDATADERVRRYLGRTTIPSGTRLVRTELYNKGRLGVLFSTGPGEGPTLLDLYYALCWRALDDEDIQLWLRGEAADGVSADEMIFGMGCSSPTTAMPKFIVAQHASAFMPWVLKAAAATLPPGVGINPLGEEGEPSGARWYDYGGSVMVLEPAQAPGWQVRLSPHASTQLRELREQNAPKETGGYLYGGWDFPLQQIYVVEVSPLPPSSKQSTTALQLGPAGYTRPEQRLSRRAAGKVARIGTWHSHPSSGAGMSARDQRSIDGFRKEDEKNGVPTLLIISSPEEDRAHLWI